MKNIERIQRLQDIGRSSALLTTAVETAIAPLSSVAATLAAQHKTLVAQLPKAFDFPKVATLSVPTVLTANSWSNSPLLKVLEGVDNLRRSIENNPELQFAFITDLEILNVKSRKELRRTLVGDDTLPEAFAKSEAILDRNLSGYLAKHGLLPLWTGAQKALASDNPDKMRHCMASIRTILEHTIHGILAPNSVSEDIRAFHAKRTEGDPPSDITRRQRLQYIISHMTFRFYDDDFTISEIQYICDCYAWLCHIHRPVIMLSENQVRTLKFNAGVTIWLLLYIHDAIKAAE